MPKLNSILSGIRIGPANACSGSTRCMARGRRQERKGGIDAWVRAGGAVSGSRGALVRSSTVDQGRRFAGRCVDQQGAAAGRSGSGSLREIRARRASDDLGQRRTRGRRVRRGRARCLCEPGRQRRRTDRNRRRLADDLRFRHQCSRRGAGHRPDPGSHGHGPHHRQARHRRRSGSEREANRLYRGRLGDALQRPQPR